MGSHSLSSLIKRIVQVVVVLLALSFVIFALMGLMPGDPLDIACSSNPRCNPANIAEMKKALGLDRPIHERYALWLSSAIQGDLGYSRTYRMPVTDIIFPRLINTFVLASLAVLVSALP